MAKTDLKSAYQHVPVHPADQHLLGIEWNGTTYLDRALPFGLSAPKLFTAVADGVPWALFHVGVHNGVHYLDDFLLWGPTDSPLCAENCERLGIKDSCVLSESMRPAVATSRHLFCNVVALFRVCQSRSEVTRWRQLEFWVIADVETV